MFSWALFVLYVCALSFVITRLKKKETSLSWKHTTAAFVFKVIAGCAYGWVHLHYYQGDDTWLYNAESVDEYAKLTSKPWLFFAELWPPAMYGQPVMDYISNNLERNITVKLLALFNFFSRGNYYINVIFFNFILFWGHYWLYYFLVKKYPERRNLLLIGVFFIPTIVFWLSGIRGDGLVFFFLALLFLQFDKWLEKKSVIYLFSSLLCLLGIFIFRSAVVMVLIPFLVGWALGSGFRWKPLPCYLLTYLTFTILFFSSKYLHPSLNLPALVAKKQEAFMALPGKTRFAMTPLTDDAGSFLKAIPSALANTLIRPVPWESKGLLQLVTSMETICYLGFILISLVFIDYRLVILNRWICGIIFFSLTLFIFIGLTIPFPGAIIRYKVIPELMLGCVMLVSYRQIKKNII
jgi:hypothetical protein